MNITTRHNYVLMVSHGVATKLVCPLLQQKFQRWNELSIQINSPRPTGYQRRIYDLIKYSCYSFLRK